MGRNVDRSGGAQLRERPEPGNAAPSHPGDANPAGDDARAAEHHVGEGDDTPGETMLSAIGESAETRATDWEDPQSHGARMASENTLREEGLDVLSPGALHHFTEAQHRAGTSIGMWMREAVYAPRPYTVADRDRAMYWIRASTWRARSRYGSRRRRCTESPSKSRALEPGRSCCR